MDQESKTKRDAAIKLLTAAYDRWLEGEDAVFEASSVGDLDDEEEERALEAVRQTFETDCSEVFEL